VHGAQDSSSFILLHEQSKVFKIIYTNCPGNVCPGKVCPGKVIVRETSVTHLNTRYLSHLFTYVYDFRIYHQNYNNNDIKLFEQCDWQCSWFTYLWIKGTFSHYAGRFTALLTHGFTVQTWWSISVRQSYTQFIPHYYISHKVCLAAVLGTRCRNESVIA